MHVIAKAYADEPLARVLTGMRGKVAYLINPSAYSANGIAPFLGVGFPRDCVHSFDESLFESLRSAWESGDHIRLQQLWKKATPLGAEVKAAA
jgi:hypothetical protein